MTLKARRRPDAKAITEAALGQKSIEEKSPTIGSSRGMEALEAARRVAPQLPPAEIEPKDQSVNHNMRVRKSTLRALGKAAAESGMSVKQFIMSAVAEKGVNVAPADLVNGSITPWKDR